MNKLVSVVMPVFNGEKTVLNSANSILSQTYEDLELLILDDGSTDKTYKILCELREKDNRVKLYLNNNNKGLTKSLNILIQNCNGDLIARQDSDDISFSNRISKQVNYLMQDKYDICVSRAKIMDSNTLIPKLSYYLPKKLVMKYKNPFIHGTAMFKIQVLKELNLYNENFYYAQDYKLFYDALKKGYRFKYIKDPLYSLNIKDNISSNYLKEQNYYADCVKNNKNP